MSDRAEIFIENEQDKLEVTDSVNALIKNVINKVLEQEDFPYNCEISVLLVDNDTIHDYNYNYRNIDRATDVLSFPLLEYDENLNIISDDIDYADQGLLLGDIVISLEKAEEQAGEFGHSFEREVGFLCAHSTLHLLGYDHEIDEESRKEMRIREEKALNALGLTR